MEGVSLISNENDWLNHSAMHCQKCLEPMGLWYQNGIAIFYPFWAILDEDGESVYRCNACQGNTEDELTGNRWSSEHAMYVRYHGLSEQQATHVMNQETYAERDFLCNDYIQYNAETNQ